jgi:hypothetical protein
MKTESSSEPAADLKALSDQFRDTKHNINNVFAVLLAMAELSERNPANYERLAKAVLERCPAVVQDLHNFHESLSLLIEKSTQP